MTAALALLLFWQADAAELVKRVAAAYEALAEFDIVVREMAVRGAGGLMDPVEKRLAASGDRFHLEIRSAIRYRIVGDGKAVWSFRVGSKKYFEEEMGEAGHMQVDGETHALVKRYGMLAAVAGRAKWLRRERVKLASGPVECEVVEVGVESADGAGWKETLWIEARRALVVRSDLYEMGPRSMGMRTYREYKVLPGERAVDGKLFEFNPAEGGRRLPSRPPAFPGRLEGPGLLQGSGRP